MTGASRGLSSQLLSGKHALVTGGSRGIGAAVVEMLLANGARVTSVSRAGASSKESVISGSREALHHVSADVTDPESVKKAFESARERFGEMAILVNNTGQAASAPFLKTDPALCAE